ncbi:uncharacterized protein LY89DRAFT_789357 [Mollisia scopiformis]|uniref:Uncharacterized protein n=1 Tax=Mollisia scopiformis TaxID=149040 RepID=A0A132B6T8_MOLSC|nr:uncharacterized protein LY89DRAFT_789357 [Mollisia scopiformis]KUJ08126.1 hypothetical protein LY89DRAFT_789357 [Mollisia scopiformis]
MSSLPTRIRQNIRDHITSPTCPLVLKTTSVTENLGYPIVLDPEWTMLWKSLQEYYPDSTIFVPTVAATILSWCDALTIWLENEENEEHVEQLLDALKARSSLTLVLEISTTSQRPTTAWRANKSVFVIALPKAKPAYLNTILAGFATDLMNLFTASPMISSTNVATKALPVLEDPEDWADLDAELDRNHQTSIHANSAARTQDVDEPMPEVSTLMRPEELTKRPPYLIVVKQEGPMKVVVHGSHTPSLACLEGYLKRWCRGEASRANRPPVVEIKLQESAFGLGLMNDALTLEAIRGREVNAMVILVFVESVLGYAPVNSIGSVGSIWEFRRMRGFK